MDVESNSDKMKIKEEQTSDNEDNFLVDSCDKIEELVHDYRGETKWKDHIALGNFEFVKLEDVKDANTDVSSTIGTTTRSDPISIEEGSFICTYCKRAFTTFEYCKKHIRKCRNRVYDQPSTSSDNVSVAAVLDKKKRLTIDQEGLYQCIHCDYKFKSRIGLYLHARRHSGVGLHTCQECNKQFTAHSILAKHMLIHTKEKPYKCIQCEVAFNRAADLKTHMLTHSGVREHKCTQCGKSFIQAGVLARHMRIHTTERPFKCIQCGKSFNISSNLTRHIRTHTNEKPFHCTVCPRAFIQKHHLKNHMKTHSSEIDSKP